MMKLIVKNDYLLQRFRLLPGFLLYPEGVIVVLCPLDESFARLSDTFALWQRQIRSHDQQTKLSGPNSISPSHLTCWETGSLTGTWSYTGCVYLWYVGC